MLKKEVSHIELLGVRKLTALEQNTKTLFMSTRFRTREKLNLLLYMTCEVKGVLHGFVHFKSGFTEIHCLVKLHVHSKSL